MRSADLVIWFDDPHARWMRQEAARRNKPSRSPQEVWRTWRRRRREKIDGRVSLIDLTRGASAPDAMAPYVQMATSDFPDKLLHVTDRKQIASLNSVRPNR